MNKDFEEKNKKISQFCVDFCKFLIDTEEDDPLPFEANYIYLILDFSCNDVAISYSADEQKFDFFDYGKYFPVSAHYFWSNILQDLSKKIFDKKTSQKKEAIKLLVIASKKAKQKCSFLRGKTIFVGERFSKVMFPI